MGKAAGALISGPKYIKILIVKETLSKALWNVHIHPCTLSFSKDVRASLFSFYLQERVGFADLTAGLKAVIIVILSLHVFQVQPHALNIQPVTSQVHRFHDNICWRKHVEIWRSCC